jgi:cytochrome c oxidase cbb3-type subunit III
MRARRYWLVWGGLAAALLIFATMHSVRSSRALTALLIADPNAILGNSTLRDRALAIGRPVFRSRCASCHGEDGRGDRSLGAPDLTRGPSLYEAGRVDVIEDIVRHGIRSNDPKGRHLVVMPAFASLHPYKQEPLPPLRPDEIEALTQFILAYTHRETNEAVVAKGAALFTDQAGCWDCHGRDARGDTAIGVPDLTHAHWLYGQGSHDDIYRSIAHGRAGFSPAFKNVLSAAELRGVSVYVASLRTFDNRSEDR